MLSSASIGINNKSLSTTYLAEETFENSCQQTKTTNVLKDCTVKLDFELEDGTTIQGEITFVDISWWDCTQIQIVAWWERTF